MSPNTSPRCKASPRAPARIWLYAVFIGYCMTLLWLLFGTRLAAVPCPSDAIPIAPYWDSMRDHINLIPGATICEYSLNLLSPSTTTKTVIAAVNLIGNMILFLPMGMLLPCLSARFRSLRRVTTLVAAMVAVVELTQLVTLLGMCDIDDLILNVLGAQLGYGLYCMAQRLFNNKEEMT